MRFRDVVEMSIGPASGHDSYWHGTTGDAARKIAASGWLEPPPEDRPGARARLASMKGHVYLSNSLTQGIGHALFYSRMRGAKDAGLVEVDAKSVKDYQPDEDELADALSTYEIHSWGMYPTPDGRWRVQEWDSLWPSEKAKVQHPPSPVPEKDQEAWALGRDLFRGFIKHDSRMMERWKKAVRMPDYGRFTSMGKTILTKMKPGDPLRGRLDRLSNRMAHRGRIKVKRVFILKPDEEQAKDIGLNRTTKHDDELFRNAEEIRVADGE